MRQLEPIQEICYKELNSFYAHYVDAAQKISVRKRRPTISPEGIIGEHSSMDDNFDAYFDRNGKLLRAISFYTDGDLDLQLKYDSLYRLESCRLTEIPSGKLIKEGKYGYDNKNRPVSKIFQTYDYETEECDGIQTYKFTYEPNRIQCFAKLADHVEEKKEVSLDTNNRIIEVRNFSFGNRFDHWITYSYNASGLLEKTNYKNVDGKITESCILIYEKDLFFKEIYESVDKSNGDGTAEYQYKFNQNGHFVEKTMLMEGELKWIEERTIKYY